MAGTPRRSLLIARLRGDLGDEPTGSGQQAILDQLRRVILDGDVLPGTAIPVDEVAELFGVSRIPVREVLKTLVGEGLVDHRPRSGYTVAQLTLAELHEIYVLRGVLEQAAVKAAVLEASADDDRAVQEAYDALGWRRRVPTTGAITARAGGFIWHCWRRHAPSACSECWSRPGT